MALDGVIGDTGQLAEIDAPGLNRPPALCMSRAKGDESERGSEKGSTDGHDDLRWLSDEPDARSFLAEQDGRAMIIDQTDWIDNGHRLRQSEPCRFKHASAPCAHEPA